MTKPRERRIRFHRRTAQLLGDHDGLHRKAET